MDEPKHIAGDCRISVDDEPDRDRSGYTFEQREDYQRLRRKMLQREYDILIINETPVTDTLKR